MFSALEIGLLAAAFLLAFLGRMPRLKAYRPLLAGGGALLLNTAFFPPQEAS